jgi:hypothetical protein
LTFRLGFARRIWGRCDQLVKDRVELCLCNSQSMFSLTERRQVLDFRLWRCTSSEDSPSLALVSLLTSSGRLRRRSALDGEDHPQRPSGQGQGNQ